MTHALRPCPDCSDGHSSSGQHGLYRDGSPMPCWTCNGKGQVPVILDPIGERAAYEEACQDSIYANDGDTWLDKSPYAEALRAAIPTRFDRKRAVMRKAQDRALPDPGERTPNV